MKNLLLLSAFLFISALSYAGAPYEDVAREMCNCVNQSTSMLSQRMIDILVESDGDEALLEAGLTKYVEEDMEAAMRDVDVLQGSMMDDMSSCFDRVTNDYEDVYTNASDEEVQAGILEAMENLDGCKSSVAFFKLGMASASEEKISEPAPSPGSNPSPSKRVDDVYFEISIEVCGCVTKSTSPLSSRMIEIFLESDGDNEKFEELIAIYAEEDAEGAMADALLLEGDVATDVDNCMARIEADYDDIYESMSTEDMENRLIASMESMEGCEVTTAIMKLASISD